MLSFRAETSRRSQGRRWFVLAGLAVLGLLPGTGCQVEYAGMTLPSGKYMHDDVQYFAPGPDFPWANTQAATVRARMMAAGETPPPPISATAPNPVVPPGGMPGAAPAQAAPGFGPGDGIPPVPNVPNAVVPGAGAPVRPAAPAAAPAPAPVPPPPGITAPPPPPQF